MLVIFLFLFSPAYAGGIQYNPWYFDLECDTYKIYQDKTNDHIDVYRYDPKTQTYLWFQNLSEYAQHFDYHSEGANKHYIAVTDESGHMLIYKWRNGEFYVWG
jgi:hypothetical protein